MKHRLTGQYIKRNVPLPISVLQNEGVCVGWGGGWGGGGVRPSPAMRAHVDCVAVTMHRTNDFTVCY